MRDCACLDSLTWRAGLARLSALLAGGVPTANALRIAHHLENLAPPPYSDVARCGVNDRQFERLLEQGALAEAAIALIGPALRHTIDTGGNARVWAEASGSARAESGSTTALALLRAWTGFMLDRCDESPSLTGQIPAGQAGASSHKSA